ncbi:DedA family protein, partial [Streptomyces sp. NPDC056948]
PAACGRLPAAGAPPRTGRLSRPPVRGPAAAAAAAGDFLAHRTGALLGDRLRTGRLGSRVPAAAWRNAETTASRPTAPSPRPCGPPPRPEAAFAALATVV